MRLNGKSAVVLCGGLSMLATSAAGVDAFPGKPIRVVTAEVGGGADFVARVVASALSADSGQQVIVDNQGGGGGVIAARQVASAPPDGYTLLLYSAGFWTLPLIQKVPYDAVRDFSPVTIAASSPSIIVVHPSLPVKSVRELIALAKAHPGALNYASGGIGATNHLAAELFKWMAGVDIVRVAYRGSGPAQNDVLAGHVQLTFASGASIMSFLKTGRLRALAVTSAAPSPLFPGLPTASSTGLPGYESVSRFSFFAPANMQPDLIGSVNRQIVSALNRADVKTKFLAGGSEVVASSPETLRITMRDEMDRLKKVIQAARISND